MSETSRQRHRAEPDPEEVREAREWLRAIEERAFRSGRARIIQGKLGGETFIPLSEPDPRGGE